MDKKAWLVSVNMGYGHQRTADNLKDLAVNQTVVNANDYVGISARDRKIWETSQKGYEFVSRLKGVPVLGDMVFWVMDYFQRIHKFYPRRDLSRPNMQLKRIMGLIKSGWGKHLIDKLRSDPRPIVNTFFTSAFMAETFNYPGEIYCTVCDADISRTWAALNPKTSRIKYFAPTLRVVERLKLYGVPADHIFFTGYPLPVENIGSPAKEILKEDLRYRLLNLDPQKKYYNKYQTLIHSHLGDLPSKSDHRLTITFCVGGAGAQKDIGIKIVEELKRKIMLEEVQVVLVAGNKKEVKDYFTLHLKRLGLKEYLGRGVDVLYAKDIKEYFTKFNVVLRKTDILWTKPSELSFYSALGIPMILAPCIGSQEQFNKRWLLKSGFGAVAGNMHYITEWLDDWLAQGYLAEMAMQAFIEGEALGTFKIKEICLGL